MDFTEYDGMILLARGITGGGQQSVADQVREWKERGCWRSTWEFERAENHVHARVSLPDRELVRAEREIAAEFGKALREAYPERRFVISHIPGFGVSFHQLAEGAPAAGVEAWKKSGVWARTPEVCGVCGRARAFRVLPTPDAEFPFVEWGVCDGCGSDVMLAQCEVRTLV